MLERSNFSRLCDFERKSVELKVKSVAVGV
jgi:hypothetical protein